MALPRTPSFNLNQRRALVTGASSGIGLGCACALAEAGATVILAARNQGNLQALAEEMRQAGWQAEVLVLDVNDLDAVEDAVASQAPFDVLVNSAGIARHAPIGKVSPADFNAVMETNLRGAYFFNTPHGTAHDRGRQAGLAHQHFLPNGIGGRAGTQRVLRL